MLLPVDKQSIGEDERVRQEGTGDGSDCALCTGACSVSGKHQLPQLTGNSSVCGYTPLFILILGILERLVHNNP